MIVTFRSWIFSPYLSGVRWFWGVASETSVWARWNSTPSSESGAKILLELPSCIWDILCVDAFWTIRSCMFGTARNACLHVWFLGLLAGYHELSTRRRGLTVEESKWSCGTYRLMWLSISLHVVRHIQISSQTYTHTCAHAHILVAYDHLRLMHERRYICACMSYLKVQGQPAHVKFNNFHIHESIKRLRLGSKVRVAAVAGRRHDEHCANWEYLHRLLAHASAGYCEHTVEKAKGLQQFLEKPSKPCPECALGKMKAPRRGQGELSTGLPEAIKPGQQFNSDIFGPFAVQGVKGKKYFITLSCTYSGWGTVSGAMGNPMGSRTRDL